MGPSAQNGTEIVLCITYYVRHSSIEKNPLIFGLGFNGCLYFQDVCSAHFLFTCNGDPEQFRENYILLPEL
jgi:hypothetical protein